MCAAGTLNARDCVGYHGFTMSSSCVNGAFETLVEKKPGSETHGGYSRRSAAFVAVFVALRYGRPRASRSVEKPVQVLLSDMSALVSELTPLTEEASWSNC